MIDSKLRAERRPTPASVPAPPSGGVLTRLRSDRRGNTLAMLAAFLIPVCALAGSAIDMARLYVVKVRLQQACDAGVLAGRKFMTSSASPTLDSTATTQAKLFFANNFTSGWMGTPTYTTSTNPYPFVPSKTADQQVSGRATTTVPMTIMKMFGSADQTLSVTCEARFDVADTDIIFVLDTTGSMACLPSETDTQCSNNNPAAVTYTRPSGSGVAGYAGSTAYRTPERMSGGVNVSRIQAVRTAVVDFYNTMADNVDPSTNIRYGFVTYSSMVNAGKAVMDMSPSYVIGGTGTGSWTYQSRENTDDYATDNGTITTNSKTQSNCPTTVTNRSPAAGYTTSGTATRTLERWVSSSGKCTVYTGQTVGPVWTYKPRLLDVGSFVAGNAVQDPTVVTPSTTRWYGCLEERQTNPGQTSFDPDNLPPDLDPDLIPTDDDSRWRPYWPNVVYNRSSYNSYPTTNGDSSSNYDWADTSRQSSGWSVCGKPVQRLKVMTATDISNYVNAPDFVPMGGTYHDIGMIWGVRMLSPTGIFGNDTAAWPGRQPPKRVIVFLTDGSMAPSTAIYGMYGVEALDRRVTNGASNPSLTNFHNARFLAACDKAKSMNIDVWTVGIRPAADANLTSCASIPGQALTTTSGTGLSSAFQQIAKQVAMLRISQ